MRIVALVAVCSMASAISALAADKPAAAPRPIPPVKLRLAGAEFGPYKPLNTEGGRIVVDPVNKETLYLAGLNGTAEFGTIGDWALAEDGTTWRQMKFTSAVLDPLRAKCQAARGPARLGEAAARNVFYAAMEAGKEAAAVKGEPARLIGEAVRLADELLKELASAKATGWEAEGIARARPLAEKAAADLKAAQTGFAAGKLDASLLANCFDAQWALDEAADCLANAPGPRMDPFVAYDPENKCVLLFGGSHGDYTMSDTWLYDCATKSWRQVWPKVAPAPRAQAAFGVKEPGTIKLAEDNRQFVLSGGATILNKMVYQQGFMPAPAGQWTFDVKAGQWSAAEDAAKTAVAPGTRLYRTIVRAYDPRWFDAAPRGDAAATAEWLAKLKPNTWTKVPVPDRPAAEREWGTARIDPDRDQIYRWSGGHQADPSDVMTTYHPGINRYSISYVAEIYGKGMSFNGRPDCMNHTYLHWAYDPVSKRLVCTSMGGTGVYNPDTGDWDYSIAQPFNRHVYLTCTVGTPKGVVVWTPGYFGVMDVAAREWKKLPVKGQLPHSETDGSALCYDSKRDCIWFASHTNYQKPSGQIWQYDMKSGEAKQMDPAGKAAVAASKGFNEIRECVYLPRLDLVLFNNFMGNKEAGYDPAKNRWVLLEVAKGLERLGTVSDTLNYDPKRDLVWNLEAYKMVYVLKLDPATLSIADVAEAAPASQPAK